MEIQIAKLQDASNRIRASSNLHTRRLRKLQYKLDSIANEKELAILKAAREDWCRKIVDLKPLFDARNNLIKKIPNFWSRVVRIFKNLTQKFKLIQNFVFPLSFSTIHKLVHLTKTRYLVMLYLCICVKT